MKLELLYFDDCPNWKIAAERLDDIASSRGLAVERRLVASPGAAEAARFRGSPTILVDGEDPFASGDEPFGLACRVYQTADGPLGPPPPSSSRRSSMRDRDLAPVAVVGAIVCRGATALIGWTVGGVALAAIGRFTAVAVAGLGVVVFFAWRLDRRRRCLGRPADVTDRSAQEEETRR